MSLNGTSALLAQQSSRTGDSLKTMLTMIVFITVMFMLMIMPQRKKAKQQELMIKALKSGDKIVTSSGIIGVVLTVKDRSVSIRSADTKLEILKSAVVEVTEHSGDSSDTKS